MAQLTWPRIVLLLGAWLGWLACNDDSNLADPPGLVKARVKVEDGLPADAASQNATSLSKALQLCFSRPVLQEKGPFRVRGTLSLKISAGSDSEAITQDFLVEMAANGDFHAVRNNSKEYGREVYWQNKLLFLRPRFGKFHKRSAQTTKEPNEIWQDILAELAAHLELVAPDATISAEDGGTVHGFATKKITLSLAATPGPRNETSKERLWRNSIKTESVSGQIVIENSQSVPLSAKLAGKVSFTVGEGRRTLEFTVEQTYEPAPDLQIVAPSGDNVIEMARQPTEVSEQNQLLKGLVPGK